MEETALQSALRAWVVNASKLDDKAVVWSEQPAVRLPLPFIVMRLGNLANVGGPDEVQYTTDLDAPAGTEMTETVLGRRELTVSIQCFGNGAETTRQVLSRVLTSLSLTGVSDALHAAGISVFDAGPVQNVSALRETAFEPRALLEVRCYVCDSVSESNTYIATVEVTNQLTDTVFTVTL